MSRYVLSIDQSTQGTKAMIFDQNGTMLSRSDIAHRQLLNDQGWVSHDPEEIYQNLLKASEMAAKRAGISMDDICCIGISNQRETTVVWNKETGRPVCDAIVWQCARAAAQSEALLKSSIGEKIQEHTGLPISPYFPASKIAWVLQNVPEAKQLAEQHMLCMGTIDTWLVWKLTGQYKTDYSNASRTQLFNIHTLMWDADICRTCGIDAADLPEVVASDAVFGLTELDGILSEKIPICSVLGDSHAALFGHGCLAAGMTKATYGTGSSIMMNIGERPISSRNGLATSLAWKFRDRVCYVMEGNVNYTGAMISWLKDQLGLIASASETEAMAMASNPSDTTCFVPAFTGLGAPHWNSHARAMICGMSRTTGKNELIRAALNSIVHQICDVLTAMEKDTGIRIPFLRIDGGPTRNRYLVQYQSDIQNIPVFCPDAEELSGMGAAYMAGISYGLYSEKVLDLNQYRQYVPRMDETLRLFQTNLWKDAVSKLQ